MVLMATMNILLAGHFSSRVYRSPLLGHLAGFNNVDIWTFQGSLTALMYLKSGLGANLSAVIDTLVDQDLERWSQIWQCSYFWHFTDYTFTSVACVRSQRKHTSILSDTRVKLCVS